MILFTIPKEAMPAKPLMTAGMEAHFFVFVESTASENQEYP